MFRQTITSTVFTSSTAESVISNLQGQSFQSDVSFLSTLRALIYPRMSEDENFSLIFTQSSYRADRISRYYDGKEAVSRLLDFYDSPRNCLQVHNFYGNAEDNEAWMKVIEENFCSVYEDWKMLERVTDLFRPIFKVFCFINPNNKATIIFTDGMDVRKMHALQAAIPGYLPWFFTEQGITSEEKELLDSLFKYKTHTQYLDCIGRIAEKHDFKTLKIQKLLRNFETLYESRELEQVRCDIQRCIRTIKDLNEEIGRNLMSKNNLETKLLGLEAKIAKGDRGSEIMEYFLNNSKVTLERVSNDSSITFCTKGYITYFDEDMAKSCIDNETSYVYCPNGHSRSNIIPKEDMRKLMTAIFIDQKLRVRTCAAYSFDMRGNVHGISGWQYDQSEFSTYTPNTHIDVYACMGNYSYQINDLLMNNDYISAIEQCVASCNSLNFGDSTVMAEFMARFYKASSRNVNVRCIELPDGRVVEPKEAIEYLKQEEQANGENN